MLVRNLAATASAAVLLFACGAALADGPPPAAAFGRVPALEDADISPDGTHLALLGANAQQKVVNIIGIDDQKVTTLPLGDLDSYDVRWAGDQQLLIGATFLQKWREDPKHVYHYDRHIIVGADGKLIGKLLGDSEDSVFITGIPVLGVTDGAKPAVAAMGLASNGHTDSYAEELSKIKRKKQDSTRALFRADATTGKSTIIERGNDATRAWIVDANGDPRIRWDVDLSHVTSIMAKPKGAGGYKVLYRTTSTERDPDILGYSTAEDAIYLRVPQKDGTSKIARQSLASGEITVIGPKTPSRSVGLKWDPRRSEPVAIVYGEEDGRYEWLDPQIGAIHASLSKAFKGKSVEFVNWSRDRKRYVIRVEAADSAPSWFLFDAGKGEVSPIQESYPELKDAKLGAKTYLTYKAGDGLEIPAYLTLPPGGAVGGKLPLIVMPHGGPGARDEAGFDYLAQFVASRGYAVLQPQFRGSAGFGAEFQEAGHKAWGGKMQTDLTDGIKTLADKGLIDPKRVCIVGWSYGGYAALAGITLHPEAYRCAASINGVTDLPMFIGEQVHAYGRGSEVAEDWQSIIGDASGDGPALAAASPAQHAERASGPVLLVAGEDDTTVPFEQSTKMKQALEDAGKPVQLVSFPGDDHYLHATKDRVAMMEALEKFLAKNLPVT